MVSLVHAEVAIGQPYSDLGKDRNTQAASNFCQLESCEAVLLIIFIKLGRHEEK